MGAKIEMVSISQPWLNIFPGNSIKLSTRAACQCIDDSGIDPCDLGLLINTGIYRHKNMGEPAIAALIQKKIRANAAREAGSISPEKTFSFDLNNGGCGWLTGIQIIGEFMNSGQISYGMVVTGDSDPFHGLSESYFFKSAAAAIVLSRSEDTEGFALFRSYSYPDHTEEFISRTDNNNFLMNQNMQNILYVRQKETYLDLCVECASESLLTFLDESGLKLNETDLIIPSQSPAGFISKMKNRIGMKDKFIEIRESGKKRLHTSGPAFALKKAWDNNRFKRSKHTIFLTVGSGITVSVALYINQN
jgi:3-oxoacyl-[acyl-carrier-protein] synthase III